MMRPSSWESTKAGFSARWHKMMLTTARWSGSQFPVGHEDVTGSAATPQQCLTMLATLLRLKKKFLRAIFEEILPWIGDLADIWDILGSYSHLREVKVARSMLDPCGILDLCLPKAGASLCCLPQGTWQVVLLRQHLMNTHRLQSPGLCAD